MRRISAIALLAVAACSSESRPTVPYEAVEICQRLLKEKAAHPSTVEFPITGRATDVRPADNAYRVRQDFTAKNAFGLELRFIGLCIFPPNRSMGAPEVLFEEDTR